MTKTKGGNIETALIVAQAEYADDGGTIGFIAAAILTVNDKNNNDKE